ncbi:MAG TPA: amidohydrolase family protein [Chthoniobacterales bacterium]|nr:amidohydrolase family protein [Chthoniobacterales bacterium]
MGSGEFVDGAFVVDGNHFGKVGRAADVLAHHHGEIVDLGEVIVLPGLINAHCHLEYGLLRGAILPSRNFPQWIGRINALKRSMTDADYVNGIELGLQELRRHGVTTVLNVLSAPQVMPLLSPPAIRAWFCLELIDVRPRPWIDDYAFGSWLFFEPPKSWLGGFGLSPHAPYTASADLYRLSNAYAQSFQMPLTTHVSESWEEYEMFTLGRGALFNFLQNMGRKMDDCGSMSPLRYLLASNLIGKRCVIVHANELDESDFALLAQPEWRSLSIVHCPKSHRFLHHNRFSLEKLCAIGLNVCIGTDSLASNDSLNLFSEMRMARRSYPFLTSLDLLKMVTTNPAHALHQENKLGRIAPGYLADAIAIPYSGSADMVHEAIVENRSSIEWMIVDGKLVK